MGDERLYHHELLLNTCTITTTIKRSARYVDLT
jgi:hypothetical protein